MDVIVRVGAILTILYCTQLCLFVVSCLSVHRISHIGKNTGSGHYVAHVKRDGQWVIYNDEKVALSENPPLQHAYLYLFQRSDTIGSPNLDF